jgi:hypothetical protein
MSEVSTEGWLVGYDAVDVAQLPTGGQVYYEYADGEWENQVPGKLGGQRLTIAVLDTTLADEYDVESGNQDNPVDWAARIREAGREPVVYCQESGALDVVTHFSQAGAKPPYFRIAAWTEDGQAPAQVEDYGAGTVAVQYANHEGYDVSLISPDYPDLSDRDAAAPAAPTEEDDMSTTSNPQGLCALTWAEGTKHVVQAIADNAHSAPLALRAVLFLAAHGSMPDSVWVAPTTLEQSAGGRIVYELPEDLVPICTGVVFEQQPDATGAAAAVYYAATAV